MNRITSAIDAVRMDDLHSTEEQFRAAHPWFWRLTLFGPLLLSGAILGFLLVYTGWEFTSKLITSAVITVLFLGRFIILSGSQGTFQDTDGALASEHLFTLVCYLDVMTALILAFHIGFLFRLPYVGTRIAALVSDGHFILDAQPWMRRATFFGLIAFVGFPLAATGSIGGSIFGRLLGMSRIATFCGIVTGTLLGNSAMFLFSDIMGNYVDKENPYLRYGGLLVIVAIVLVLERRYRMLKKRYTVLQQVQSEAAARSPDDAVGRDAASADAIAHDADAREAADAPKAEPVRVPLNPPVSGLNGVPASVGQPHEVVAGEHVGSRPHPR
jgi:uncharacterized membrane protein